MKPESRMIANEAKEDLVGKQQFQVQRAKDFLGLNNMTNKKIMTFSQSVALLALLPSPGLKP